MINEGVLNKHGSAKIVDAIKERKVLKPKYSKCDKECSVSISVHKYLLNFRL